MTEFLQLLFAGAANGAIYGLLALALVLVYRSTHIVNLAQGEMAMFTTYLAWSLLNAGAPYWAAFFGALAIGFVGGLLVFRMLIYPVREAPELAIFTVTIGIFLFFNSIALWIYSGVPKPFPIPAGVPKSSWDVAGVFIIPHHLTILVVLLALMAVLFGFFRYTKLGLLMRASAAQPHSAALVGINVTLMMALGWGVASAIGAVAGTLSAPIVVLEPSFMFAILIWGIASATLGGLDSAVGAVVGGLIVGEVAALGSRYIDFIGTDLQIILAFFVIVAVLLVRPAGLFGRPEVVRV